MSSATNSDFFRSTFGYGFQSSIFSKDVNFAQYSSTKVKKILQFWGIGGCHRLLMMIMEKRRKKKTNTSTLAIGVNICSQFILLLQSFLFVCYSSFLGVYKSYC